MDVIRQAFVNALFTLLDHAEQHADQAQTSAAHASASHRNAEHILEEIKKIATVLNEKINALKLDILEGQQS